MDWVQNLIENGLITPEQASAIEFNLEQGSQTYEQAMAQAGISVRVIREALADYYNLESVELSKNDQPLPEVLQYVPEESARYYRILPLRKEDGVLVIATSDPDNLQMRQAIHFISTKHDLPHKFVFMLDSELEEHLASYESLSGEVDEALGSIEDQLERDIAEKEQEVSGAERTDLKEDAPVTKIVATILRYAVEGNASDIHIEPTGEKVMVRFRVDGVLQKSLELPKKVQSAVAARVKILSSMRLDEKRRPQDGRFSATFDGNKIDFRVSVLPINHGEKIVMRILDTSRGVRTLEDTGISLYHLETIRRIIKEPYGIILISGPTGSGKSTTLYAMLSEIDRTTKNVISLEDPVEYNIPDVNQSQMRPEIGYTFASGLRSALRQDPDIIMVGEIRDKETAQLAIQAALTGHLVLSTIHTNNSIGVIPRLIDMGIDPYLIAPTLKLAIAQRLSRRLCPNSGVEVSTAGAIDMMIKETFKTLPEKFHKRIPQTGTMKHPEPSPGCTSGTRGRVAVMESLEITEDVQELILTGGSEEDIYNVVRKRGFMTMKEDAIIKALNHVIPYEEVSAFGTKVGTTDGLVDDFVEDTTAVDTPTAPPPAADTKEEKPLPPPLPPEEPVDNQMPSAFQRSV